MKKIIISLILLIATLSVVSADAVKISKINDMKSTINVGDKYVLPTKVKAIMSDKSVREIAVTWDKKVIASKPGVYTYLGTVKGYGKKVNFVLTIVSKTPAWNAPVSNKPAPPAPANAASDECH